MFAVAENCGPAYRGCMDNSEIRRQRLRAFMKARGLSQTAVAKIAGMSEGTFRAFLKGDQTKNLRLDRYDAIADAFGIPVDDLVGVGRPPVPVVGMIGAGEEIHPFDDGAPGSRLDEIEVPPSVPLDAVAVIVKGQSMWPDYWPGDVIVYRRDVPFDREACLYQDCVVRVLDGPTLVKRVKPGSRPDLLTLESTNAPPRVDQRIEWAAPVLYHDKSRRKPRA